MNNLILSSYRLSECSWQRTVNNTFQMMKFYLNLPVSGFCRELQSSKDNDKVFIGESHKPMPGKNLV